mmetsp:Transcript_22684/g.35057  ORF Transcript_22684/g.35057 Transcript_22684/m.35057 type:complete len:354 (-) Transcript_22684:144-1205(-)
MQALLPSPRGTPLQSTSPSIPLPFLQSSLALLSYTGDCSNISIFVGLQCTFPFLAALGLVVVQALGLLVLHGGEPAEAVERDDRLHGRPQLAPGVELAELGERGRQVLARQVRVGGHDPGVPQQLRGGLPLLVVHHQHLGYQVPRLLGHVVPVGRMELVLPPADLAEELVLVLVVEGRVAPQQDVRDHARRPQVRLPAVLEAAEDLGGHVTRGAAGLLHLPHLGDVAGEAEVGDLDVGVVLPRGQQQVLRLQVPVHDVVGVQVVQRAQQQGHQVARLLLRVLLLLHDAVEQLPAHHQLEDEDGLRALVEHVRQLDHVLVVQLLHDLDLVLQRLGVFRLQLRAVHNFGGPLLAI